MTNRLIAFGAAIPGDSTTHQHPHRGMSVRLWAARDADHSDNRPMTEPLPSCRPHRRPTGPSCCAFRNEDAHLAVELGRTPTSPHRQPARPPHCPAGPGVDPPAARPARRTERFSFAIADAESDNAVGAIGLGLQHLSVGRATGGYTVSPLHRGRGIATSALTALTSFAWTIPGLYRVELYIEPWNTSSTMLPKRPATGGRACCVATRSSAAPAATCCCMGGTTRP
jgi:[ribosomal protein S5]-alanine N-acetyltransferase